MLFIAKRKQIFIFVLHRALQIAKKMTFMHSPVQCSYRKFFVRSVAYFNVRNTSEWQSIVSDAERIVGYPTSFLSLRCLLSDELSNVALHMRRLVGTRHPLIQTAKDMISNSKHGLHTQGLIILLQSKAAGCITSHDSIDDNIISGILPSQRSLAEITEVIHTANLIHKGVVNISDLTPDDGPICDMELGNKMAVLCGDFLLAKACIGLAEFGDTKVVDMMAGAISDLMEAEFTGFTDRRGACVLPDMSSLADWKQQVYLQSGSLLANSCKAAVKLGGHGDDTQEDAFHFGSNTACVQQLNDELKAITRGDYTNINITSAPAIMLHEKKPELVKSTIQNGSPDFTALAEEMRDAGVIEECCNLCEEFAGKAVLSLASLPPSDAKTTLTNLVAAARRV